MSDMVLIILVVVVLALVCYIVYLDKKLQNRVDMIIDSCRPENSIIPQAFTGNYSLSERHRLLKAMPDAKLKAGILL